MLLHDTTEAEYKSMAEEDDGLDASGLDSQDDDYDPTDYNTGRAFW